MKPTWQHDKLSVLAPCDKCYTTRTHYKYSCDHCTQNPHTPEEILAEQDIFKDRFDRFNNKL